MSEPEKTVGRTDPPCDQLVRAVLPGAELRDAGDGSAPTLHGHFAVFDEWTEIDSYREGRFLERIAPGAFKKTMAEQASRVRVLLNHGADPMLGDKPLGAVRSLEEDDTGAAYEVELFRGIPEIVMDGLRAGQYGASFRFSVLKDKVNRSPDPSARNPEGLVERTITEVRLHEFGPVTFPAYPTATAGVRSMTDRFITPAPPPDAAPVHVEEEGRDEQDPPAPAPRVTPVGPLTKMRKDRPSWRLP